MYLTYNEYLEMGGTLDETAFSDYVLDADILIDWYTFNRLHHESNIPERVKQCVFKLISLADTKAKAFSLGHNLEGTDTALVTSQSNDGVSITYNALSASQAFDLIKSESDITIKQYLNGVVNSVGRRLLYRGVYPDE